MCKHSIAVKKLLVEGWRGVNHSYAMVNQHQVPALAQLGGLEVFHHDTLYRRTNWNWKEHSGCFEEKTQLIASLADLPQNQGDVIYRNSAPPCTSNSRTAITITAPGSWGRSSQACSVHLVNRSDVKFKLLNFINFGLSAHEYRNVIASGGVLLYRLAFQS
jgi:hypothetical protein